MKAPSPPAHADPTLSAATVASWVVDDNGGAAERAAEVVPAA